MQQERLKPDIKENFLMGKMVNEWNKGTVRLWDLPCCKRLDNCLSIIVYWQTS